MNYKVLVACEESQAVCIAFRRLGFEAYSCDLQECSGGYPEWHIQGDAIAEAYSGKYDMMIAHPPCTHLSRAGARWMFQGGRLNHDRLQQAQTGKEFFLRLANAPIRHIALENPTPIKLIGLPEYSQAIEPYEFGHHYSKRTLLWLKNLPPLVATNVIRVHTPYLPSNTGGAKRGQKATPKSITQKESSKTFQGIADAMAAQWGAALKAGYRDNLLFQ